MDEESVVGTDGGHGDSSKRMNKQQGATFFEGPLLIFLKKIILSYQIFFCCS